MEGTASVRFGPRVVLVLLEEDFQAAPPTADAVPAHFDQYISRRMAAVIGTTGWNAHRDSLRSEAARAG